MYVWGRLEGQRVMSISLTSAHIFINYCRDRVYAYIVVLRYELGKV